MILTTNRQTVECLLVIVYINMRFRHEITCIIGIRHCFYPGYIIMTADIIDL